LHFAERRRAAPSLSTRRAHSSRARRERAGDQEVQGEDAGEEHRRGKPAAPIRFVIGPAGNEARYRVREQLMGANLPNDAIGVTKTITGTILAYPDGRIVKDSSKIVIHLDSLKSDKDRRDGFLRRRTLETEKFPTVELIPTEIRGFNGKLPASGTATSSCSATWCSRGSRIPTVWNVTARAEGHGRRRHGDDGVHLQGRRTRPAEGAGGAERRGHDQAGVRFQDREAVGARSARAVDVDGERLTAGLGKLLRPEAGRSP
jgi:hypothetical protein